MPAFYGDGLYPWNVTKLGSSSPQIIVNGDGTQATRFGGIWTDTVQTGKTMSVYDTSQTASLTANQIFSVIAQAVNTLVGPPTGGCELTNGLVVEFKAGVAGQVYVYWK